MVSPSYCIILHKSMNFPLHFCGLIWTSLIAQLVKNSPAMQETWVWSLGWEDPLEKGKAIHSSILTSRITCTCPWGHKELDTTERLSLSLHMISTFSHDLLHLSVSVMIFYILFRCSCTVFQAFLRGYDSGTKTVSMDLINCEISQI